METVPAGLVEAVARALFETADRLPGARVPVIVAEDLARAALDAITAAGVELHPLPAADGAGVAA